MAADGLLVKARLKFVDAFSHFFRFFSHFFCLRNAFGVGDVGTLRSRIGCISFCVAPRVWFMLPHLVFKLGVCLLVVVQVPRRCGGAAEGQGGIALQPVVFSLELS